MDVYKQAAGQQPKGFQRKTYDLPDCPICLEELVQDLVCAPCGHVFHSVCLYQNFEASSQCPCCRKRMTRANITAMTYSLKCNDEAEEQIQAFYNSLTDSERQNVVEIMNKFEHQTKDLISVRRHRDELVTMAKEQKDRLHQLEKSEKELSTSNKKLLASKDQLTQRVNLEECKRKDLQSLHDSDLVTIDELKKNLSELRHFQILKEKLDMGGTNEDRLIEEIRKNKPIEDQAKKFYELLRMKKGACEELKQENGMLQNQLKNVQLEAESMKSDLKFKQNRINELETLVTKLSDRSKRQTEVMANQKKTYQERIQKLSQTHKDQLNNQRMSDSDVLRNNRSQNMFNLDHENSNFSIFSDVEEQQLRFKNSSSSLSNNDLTAIQLPFNPPVAQKNNEQTEGIPNSLIGGFMKSMSNPFNNQNNNNMIGNNNNNNAQEYRQKDTLQSIISQNSNSIGFYKENISKDYENSNNNNNNPQEKPKRTFESTFSVDQFKLQKQPRFEGNNNNNNGKINPLIGSSQSKNRNDSNEIPTGGQGLFGIMSKNSLLKKQSNQIKPASGMQQQKLPGMSMNMQNQSQKPSHPSISDFFLKKNNNNSLNIS